MVARGRRTRVVSVIAIGGTDPSAGAGVQADLRTLQAMGVVPLTVVSAVTVQDGLGVSAVQAMPTALIRAQLRTIARRFGPAALKCGQLPNASVVRGVAAEIRTMSGIRLVVDPVVRATGGGALAVAGTVAAIRKHLFPLATVVTVNTEEAAVLCAGSVTNVAGMEAAAREISAQGAAAVVVKGGHLRPGARVTDVVWDGERMRRFSAPRLRRGSLHGSGCAFASALAAGLALGETLEQSVRRARAHVLALIATGLPIGSGILLRPPAPRV